MRLLLLVSRVFISDLRVFPDAAGLTEAAHTASSLPSSPIARPLHLSRLPSDLTIYSLMTTHRVLSGRQGAIETRKGLLKTARALLVLKDLATVTVDDICLAAGVSKGGFYHYFPDKESAFLEVTLEELRQEMELVVAPTRDRSATPGASALLVELWAWAPRRPAARRRVHALHRRALRTLLHSRGAHDGPPTGDREAQAMVALFVEIGGVIQHAMTQRPASSERRRGEAAAS